MALVNFTEHNLNVIWIGMLKTCGWKSKRYLFGVNHLPLKILLYNLTVLSLPYCIIYCIISLLYTYSNILTLTLLCTVLLLHYCINNCINITLLSYFIVLTIVLLLAYCITYSYLLYYHCLNIISTVMHYCEHPL